MAAAKEIRIDVAAAALLSEADGIFTLKAEQKRVTGDFSWRAQSWRELCKTQRFNVASCGAVM